MHTNIFSGIKCIKKIEVTIVKRLPIPDMPGGVHPIIHLISEGNSIDSRRGVAMSSKTKIVVLHMKELIYTGIFAALGILFIILLIIMFLPGKDNSSTSPDKSTNTENSGETTQQEPEANSTQSTQTGSGSVYIPGVYTTELVLNDQTIDVEVIVDKDYISSIRLVNLNEAVTTMYPLLQPTFDSLCEQICEKQTLENITYDTESKYTSLVLLEAIKNSLDKASALTVPEGEELQE